MEASLIPTPKVDAPAPPQLPHDAPHTAARDFLVVSPEGLQRPPLLLLLLLLRLLLQSIHSHSSSVYSQSFFFAFFLGWSGVSWEFNGFATFRSLNLIANRIPTSRCSLLFQGDFSEIEIAPSRSHLVLLACRQELTVEFLKAFRRFQVLTRTLVYALVREPVKLPLLPSTNTTNFRNTSHPVLHQLIWHKHKGHGT